MATALEPDRVHQTRPATTRGREIRVPVNRSRYRSSQFSLNFLGPTVEQWERTCNHSTCSVDVLNRGNDDLGVLGDRLHAPQAVIEIVRDAIEQDTDDKEVDRQNSDQQRDADNSQEDKSHL